MSTAQGTASPRAPRGKQHHGQAGVGQPVHNNTGRQGQHRKPRGNRAHNGNTHSVAPGGSPSRQPPGALAESAALSGEESQPPTTTTTSRNPKRHAHHSQPSIDRVISPNGPHASLTDSESGPANPSATPAKSQGAYAGPTFHASPAPSALPIPKFLSKSVPAKTRPGPPTPPPDESSDSAGSPGPDYPSPSRAPIPVPRRNDDSPLDLLFKADRAERAKNGGGSPASNGFFSPPHSSRPAHHKHDSYSSLNAPFPIELDAHPRPNHISPPPAASPVTSRSVTDPTKVPQLKDATGSPNSNDVMQDLLSRLSQSQRQPVSRTPPGPDAHAPSDPQTRHETPSPTFDGRAAVRSASGPSTPAAASHEAPDFFYGNRNLSPLFKAAKGDTAKRNSGLRTEITADSPLVEQGMFQDFPSVSSPQAMAPNPFPHQAFSGVGGPAPTGPRRGSVPYVQPYREMPNNSNNNNNRRRTPAKQPHQLHQPRPDSYPAKAHPNGNPNKFGRGGANGPQASVKKPATSMMSFVPASVAAKKLSSTPPLAATPPTTTNASTTDTMTLEQDLKRLLNLKMDGAAPGVQ